MEKKRQTDTCTDKRMIKRQIGHKADRPRIQTTKNGEKLRDRQLRKKDGDNLDKETDNTSYVTSLKTYFLSKCGRNKKIGTEA